jgi:hypothetical protein
MSSDSTVVAERDPIDERSERLLTVPEYNMLRAYIEKGGHPLAPETAASLFELYLNGSSCGEIHRLNKAFKYEAILWSRIKYEWDRQKDEFAISLTERVKEKAIRAALDTTSLLSDMLVAANKKHGDRLKRYIQTGNEEDLGDAMSIDSIASLTRAVEGLQKITGADQVKKIKKEETLNVNLNANGLDNLSPETSAVILAALAKEKREKIRGPEEDE